MPDGTLIAMFQVVGVRAIFILLCGSLSAAALLPWCARWRARFLRLSAFLLLFSVLSHADTAAFDLPGPRIDIKVTRAGKTLPIAQVPNLQPGDRLWLHAEMPSGQTVHYLLIASFLRGSTNPPPEQWFTKIETWNKQVEREGTVITVPETAQQALLFLAPETGGDYGTLRSAVRGKPGAFVRASQDLDQAALDRSRLDKYLAGIREVSDNDPKGLHDRSLVLSRSLKIKVNEECFDKPAQEQASCLTQHSDQLVLDDGHSQSMVSVLTSGAGSDLVGAISTTKLAGGGAYSPYVGAVVDMARMMESFHTANYQYIPALAMPKHEELNLKLNNPPSFHKPMSVLVVGLPAIEASQPPPLRAVEPKDVFCLQQKGLTLPVDGAPLVFSTDYAHDMVLHVQTKSGLTSDLPASADAARGGFVIDASKLHASDLEAGVTGTLRGYWGFEAFSGPVFALQSAYPAKWLLASADSSALIVGRQDSFHLQSDKAPCVNEITMRNEHGKPLKTSWKLLKANELEVEVPLQDEAAGAMAVLIEQSGLAKPDEVPVQAYSEAAHLDRFSFNAGDRIGVLTGTRLDQVSGIDLNGLHFAPSGLARVGGKDELQMTLPSTADPAGLQGGQKIVARVALKDGRQLSLDTVIQAPRPRLALVSKTVQPGPSPSGIRLGTQEDLPQDGQLSFFLKSENPSAFPRDEKIEVATEDGSVSTMLSLSSGSLVLEDPQTVLATLQPLKTFGGSVFGGLRFRAVGENGEHGDWQPLVKLVRVPTLKEVHCPDSPDKRCVLLGQNLFLLDSIASDAEFTHNVAVPSGFMNSSVEVPRPNGTLLYLKLRDDPSVVNKAVLPVLPEP